MTIPSTASDHPARWKFDLPIYHPPDLAAWRANPAARNAWAGFPPSARKQMLWWIVSAARPETRTKRIATIVSDAASGRRAQG